MREIIMNALTNDEYLGALGFDENSVFPNWGMYDVPRDRRFLIVRFEEQDIRSPAVARGPHIITVWVHQPEEISTDFAAIRDILDEVKGCLLACVDETAFGYRISSVKFSGYGGDFKDPGYNTLTKNAGFEILAHRVG